LEQWNDGILGNQLYYPPSYYSLSSSAPSASSSFTLLSSSPDDRKPEKSQYPKNDLCFLSLQRKNSAASAYSAVDIFFFILGRRKGFYNFLSKNKIREFKKKGRT